MKSVYLIFWKPRVNWLHVLSGAYPEETRCWPVWATERAAKAWIAEQETGFKYRIEEAPIVES